MAERGRPKRRNVAAGFAVVVGGAVVGAAVEELLARRFLPRGGAADDIRPPEGERIRVRSFDGTEIAATISGRADAPCLLFAHGVIESSALWHYQVRDPVLADRYRLVAYDARGHGRSGPARGPRASTPFTTQSQARDLIALIEEAVPDRVVLIGHSMGGLAIQALWDGDIAGVVGEKVAGVVLVNTTFTGELAGWRGGGSRPQRAFERVEDVAQRLIGSERLVSRFRPRMSDFAMLCARVVFGRRPSPEHLAASVRIYNETPSATIAAMVDLATADLYQALPRIDVPALVVAGSRDQITPPWLSEEIAARVPKAQLVVFDDCGHVAPFERHEELNSLIAKFCETVL